MSLNQINNLQLKKRISIFYPAKKGLCEIISYLNQKYLNTANWIKFQFC